MKGMASGLRGGTSFMGDYTYHLDPAGKRVLGAHRLELCPSIAGAKPAVQVHPLGIGGKADPARLVFNTAPGQALNASLLDLGNRFRLLVNQVQAVAPEQPMPKLPVAQALWVPEPNFEVAAACWLNIQQTRWRHCLRDAGCVLRESQQPFAPPLTQHASRITASALRVGRMFTLLASCAPCRVPSTACGPKPGDAFCSVAIRGLGTCVLAGEKAAASKPSCGPTGKRAGTRSLGPGSRAWP